MARTLDATIVLRMTADLAQRIDAHARQLRMKDGADVSVGEATRQLIEAGLAQAARRGKRGGK